MLVLLLTLIQSLNSLTYTVPSGNELCFFEELENNDKLEGSFQVVRGGDLHISFSVSSFLSRPFIFSFNCQCFSGLSFCLFFFLIRLQVQIRNKFSASLDQTHKNSNSLPKMLAYIKCALAIRPHSPQNKLV